MERTIRTLKLLYFIPIIVSLLLVVCFETGLLLEGSLCLSGGKQCEFVITTVMELLTICVIPIALRLFKMRRVCKALHESPENLLRFGCLRLMLIMLPMVLDTLFYYLFMAVPFGYLAIILFLSSIFIYPSASRCKSEVGTNSLEE